MKCRVNCENIKYIKVNLGSTMHLFVRKPTRMLLFIKATKQGKGSCQSKDLKILTLLKKNPSKKIILCCENYNLKSIMKIHIYNVKNVFDIKFQMTYFKI